MRFTPSIAAAALVSMLSASVAAQHPPRPQPAAPAPAGQTAQAQPGDAQREAAREAYARGQALFAEGKHAEAKVAFEQAYAQVPNPVVLVSIAECEVRLGNLETAHDVFQRYLKERPDAPDRAEVEQKVAELAATQATLVLTSEPTGALIVLDGVNTGKTTPAEMPVARGEHSVELSLAGHLKAAAPVTARIGARHELHVTLEPEPPPPPPTPSTPPSGGIDDRGSPTTALWITGVVGAVGLVTGTVLGFMVLAERSDFDSEPTVESADRGERLALFTDVAFGIGAMALITGAVIYLTADAGGDEDEGEADAARLRLSPVLARDGAGIVAGTRF